MNYIVSIDNSVFTNKDEALKYLENKFIIEQTEANEPDKIISIISSNLPTGIKVNLIYENSGWGKYKIEVGNDDFTIDAYLDPNKKESCGGLYTSIDDVVQFYSWSIPTVLDILSKVKERYDFKTFKLDRYHDDYGNGNYFDFSYETNEGNGYQTTYEGGDVETFIDKMEQHFVNVLCGDFEEFRDGGYFEDYTINDIPIKGLLERARKLGKQVKLEIIE